MSEIESKSGSEQVYVAALICERVIESKDGIYSAINIFDKFEIDVPEGMEVPESFPAPTVYCMSIFRSPVPLGFTVVWRIVRPDGVVRESPPERIDILPGKTGHTSVFEISLKNAALTGTYLVEVLVDGRRAAFTPLSIAHVPSPSSLLAEDAPDSAPDQ
ncbi:MAG: hypothetical protein LAP87_15980 [Acidobacteriia bacterium]|nr:hypothetical protein [Terriglobia bacterium]